MSTRTQALILAVAAMFLVLPLHPAAAQTLDKAERICAAAKLKATGKKAHAKLNCEAKGILQELSAADPECLAKVESKFATKFESVELKGGCLSDGDAAAVENSVDTFVAAEVGRQKSGVSLPTCTTPMASCGTCGTGTCLPADIGMVCISTASAISPCPTAGCPVGTVCLSASLLGTSLCAIGCP